MPLIEGDNLQIMLMTEVSCHGRSLNSESSQRTGEAGQVCRSLSGGTTFARWRFMGDGLSADLPVRWAVFLRRGPAASFTGRSPRPPTPLDAMTGGQVNSRVRHHAARRDSHDGREVGHPARCALAIFRDGNDVVLLASNYDETKHPRWYYNLLKNPDCELSADGNGGRFFVHPTEGADHDRWFPLAEGRHSGYGKYAANAKDARTIRVLRLTPG
jgi:deazaflavin-dependent oxidoreductase (nitroreductase family)